jgi:hypothetical protein
MLPTFDSLLACTLSNITKQHLPLDPFGLIKDKHAFQQIGTELRYLHFLYSFKSIIAAIPNG